MLGFEAQAVTEDINSDNKGVIHAYFSDNYEINHALSAINKYLQSISESTQKKPSFNFIVNELNKKDWEEWKSYLKTVKVGNKIVVTPPWENYEVKKGELVIEINPSLAFGTGHHETTKLCIQFLEELIKGDESILDIGCGSGILGISSIKLGAKSVLSVDIDPKSIIETISNSKRNNVYKFIKTFCGTVSSINKRFNIIVANISIETLISIKNEVTEKIKENGFIVLSGIPKIRKDEVVRAYVNNKLEFISTKTDGDWVALLFKSL